MFLFIWTETTGLPKDWNKPFTDSENWPHIVQLTWRLHGEKGELIEAKSYYIIPEGFSIPKVATKIHGINTKFNKKHGVFLKQAIHEFSQALSNSKYIVGHNVYFDIDIIGSEFHRLGLDYEWMKLPNYDTCSDITANLCDLPGGRGNKHKLPTLAELYFKLFNNRLDENQDSIAAVEATAKCFFELKTRGLTQTNNSI